MSRRGAWPGTWRLRSCNRGFCPLRRRCRLRNWAVKCLQHNRPTCLVRADLALARAGRPCTNHRQKWHRNAQWKIGHGVSARCNARCRPALTRVLCGKAMMGTCGSNLWRRTRSTRFAASTGEPEIDRIAQSSAPCAGSPTRQAAMRTRSTTSLTPRLGKKQQRSGTRDAVRHLRRGLLVTECLATTLDRRQRAMPACRTLQQKCVETRNCCGCWGSGENEALWYGRPIVGPSRLVEDWAARAPSCCVIWWQRQRQTDSAARMLSDDGGPSWSEYC